MRLVIIDLFSPFSYENLTIPSLYKVLVELSTEANIRGNCCIIITFEGHMEKFVCLSCALLAFTVAGARIYKVQGFSSNVICKGTV